MVTNSNSFILVGDLSATNTTLALFDSQKLLFKWPYQSQKINNFTKIIQQILTEVKLKHNLIIEEACLAVAGPIPEEGLYAKLTNTCWGVDVLEIKKSTSLQKILLINDFAAIAFGIDLLPKSDFLLVRKGLVIAKKPRILIGAGTGLGKAILVWHNSANCYLPLNSEGGHADVAITNLQELELIKFIQNKHSLRQVAWEQVLSGVGLQNLYQFLQIKLGPTKNSSEIIKNNYNPNVISKLRQIDPLCQETFRWFSRFYARCIKNYSLDILAPGGIYIAGGIGTKNQELFVSKEFQQELVSNKKMQPLLEKNAIFLIKNYDISLYGAWQAVQLSRKGII